MIGSAALIVSGDAALGKPETCGCAAGHRRFRFNSDQENLRRHVKFAQARKIRKTSGFLRSVSMSEKRAMIFHKFRKRTWRAAEQHRKVGRYRIVGGRVGRGDMREIIRTPRRQSCREQPGFMGLRRDGLIRHRTAGDGGHRRRDIVIAIGGRPGERVGLAGIRHRIAQHGGSRGADSNPLCRTVSAARSRFCR